jgi:hypothetical protein
MARKINITNIVGAEAARLVTFNAIILDKGETLSIIDKGNLLNPIIKLKRVL